MISQIRIEQLAKKSFILRVSQRQSQLTSHERALQRLLDDPSEVVQAHIEQELSRMGDSGLNLLRLTAEEQGLERSKSAERLLRKLDGGEALQQLFDFIEAQNFDLETGMGLINRVVDPSVDLVELKLFLDRMAKRCAELMVPPQTPKQICGVINRVLFHEYGFRGNTEHYEDPRNSLLKTVFETRRGIPISLSTIYLLVASRLNFTLEGVGLPGHFMVGSYYGNIPFFIDPFQRGRIRTVEEVNLYLLDHSVKPEVKFLMPVTAVQLLSRVCRNLVDHYKLQNRMGMAEKFERVLEAFESSQEEGSNC